MQAGGARGRLLGRPAHPHSSRAGSEEEQRDQGEESDRRAGTGEVPARAVRRGGRSRAVGGLLRRRRRRLRGGLLDDDTLDRHVHAHRHRLGAGVVGDVDGLVGEDVAVAQPSSSIVTS